MPRSIRGLINWAAIFLTAATANARDDLDRFLTAIPDSTNTLTLIRMRAIMDTSIAKREGWAQKRESQYLEGAVLVPPTSPLVVVATRLAGHALTESLTIGFIAVEKEVSNAQFLAREKGEIQYVAGETVFMSARNAYYVGRGTKYLAVITPADRQELAHWLKFAKRNQESVLPDYLKESADAEPTAHVMIAIDPQDLFLPDRLEARAKNSQALAKNDKPEVATFAFFLRSLRGVRLTAQVGENTTATLRFDFRDKTGPEARMLKPFLIELFDDWGAEIEELASAELSIEEKSIILKSRISIASLKHVLSLVLPPIPKIQPPEPVKVASKPQPTKEELTLKASMDYYQQVNKLVGELEKKYKKATDYEKTALWHDSYAKRIEQLPDENVDPSLLKYGADTAARLHALADSLRGVVVELNALQTGMYYRSSGGVGIGLGAGGRLSLSVTAGGGAVDSNVGQIRTLQAQAVAKGAETRMKIWNMIRDERSSIRNRMQNKFKVNFDPAAG
jgi:hypothetical protein